MIIDRNSSVSIRTHNLRILKDSKYIAQNVFANILILMSPEKSRPHCKSY